MLEEVITGLPGYIESSEPYPGVRCMELDVRTVSRSLHSGAERGVLEILFCLSGEVTAVTEGGRLFCSARQALLLWEGGFAVSTDGRRLQGVLVRADFTRGAFSGLFGGAGPDADSVAGIMESGHCALNVGPNTWSEAVFSALRELGAGERADYCAVKAAELLYLMLRRRERESAPRVRYRDPYVVETVRRIHGHMMDNLGEKLTISSLSEAFHIAPTSFKECFRELYGTSVHQYILGKRMERAGELLRSTAMPVFQVAETVGYGSPSQFGVEFKRRYSMSPLAYRRAMREKIV